MLRRLLAVAEFAEIGGETQLVILRKGLAAEYQHKVAVPGLLDRPNCRGRKRGGEVDPADLRTACGRQGRDLDMGDISHDVLRRRGLRLQPIRRPAIPPDRLTADAS